MSNRDVGDVFEKAVRGYLKHVGLKPQETTNSGAYNDDGDIKVLNYLIECKNQAGGKNAIIKSDEFVKLVDQARRTMKTPILAIRSGRGEDYAVMDLRLLCQLLSRIYDLEHPNPSEY